MSSSIRPNDVSPTTCKTTAAERECAEADYAARGKSRWAEPTVELKIRPPKPPSYVFVEGLHEGAKIGIEHLTEAQLRSVGEAFTAALIAHATQRSANAVPRDRERQPR